MDTAATRTTGTPGDDDRRHFTALRSLAAGTPRHLALRGRLITENLPLAARLARHFSSRGEPYEDLEQVARLGLINAVDRYDPARGPGFPAFALPTITGEIKRHFRDRAWAIRPPRALQELQARVKVAADELAQRDGRAPRPSDIAEYLGIDREQVVNTLIAADAYRHGSLDAHARDHGDTMPGPAADADAFRAVDDWEQLRPALTELPERERTIIILRFFREMSQQAVAAEIGVSQVHVSRLLDHTLRWLRTRLDAA